MSIRTPAVAWTVWATGLACYIVAVVNRTSLSALGPAAQDHFSIDATALASFAVIQLVVYAGMQIPVGLLIDRVGPTAVILTGSVVMAVGQTLMATVEWMPLVYAARVLVGAGDAATFTSLLRIVKNWFPARQLPVVTQLTGLAGQSGQILSVVPLTAIVTAYGWSAGFLTLSGIGVGVALLALFVLRDHPRRATAWRSTLERVAARRDDALPPATGSIPVVAQVDIGASGGGILRNLGSVLSRAGVRLAFWVHFTTPFSSTALMLLWGYPFLVSGLGLSPETAKGLFTLHIVAAMATGLLLGPITARFRRYRVGLVAVGITLAVVAAWTVVLAWPGVPPLPVIVVFMIVVATGGPASMIAFDVVRVHAPSPRLGVGTGFVNVGGFLSALLVIQAVGIALDAQGAGDPSSYTLDAFRVAWSVQYPVWALGLTMIFIELGRVRRRYRHLR